jgi:hypothetical protein
MRTVRRFNQEGTRLFGEYLSRLREGASMDPPRALLDDPATSRSLEGGAQVESRVFDSRRQAGQYLFQVLDGKVPRALVDHNPDLWNWLSLFYFDQLCPRRSDGTRNVRSDYRYILKPVSDPDHFRHYYRHLLAGAYTLFRQYRDGAGVLLAGAVDKFDDFNEQLASRQEFVSNAGIIEAVDLLYYDQGSDRPKRGAASNKRRPGTLRRFVDVIQQLDLTYDLYSLTGPELLKLLPPEFNRWRPSEREAA